MKKLSIIMVVAIAVAMASCTAQAPKTTMKTDLDTVSYDMGYSSTDGLTQFLMESFSIDSTQMDDFVKGVLDGIKMQRQESKKAYYVGLTIAGQALKIMEGATNEIFGEEDGRTINENNFIAGFVDGAKNKYPEKDPRKIQPTVMMMKDKVKSRVLEEKYGENKAAGEAFLAENALKEGVIVTESGLQYKVINEGTGAIPTQGDRVEVNYTGKLIDGTKFDSSYDHPGPNGEVKPTRFSTRQVVKGWQEALLMMPVGSKWEIYLPQELAYGTRKTGELIEPFSALIFEVELVSIVEK